MKQQDNSRLPVGVIKTLTEFTPLGMASALAAIARRSSRQASVDDDRRDSYAGLCWCPCGAT